MSSFERVPSFSLNKLTQITREEEEAGKDVEEYHNIDQEEDMITREEEGKGEEEGAAIKKNPRKRTLWILVDIWTKRSASNMEEEEKWWAS